jgi:hypothetical protein
MGILKDQHCPDCHCHQLTWHCVNRTRSGSQDGQLNLSDVETVFLLVCDICGEHLREASGNAVSEFLNSYMHKAKPVNKAIA